VRFLFPKIKKYRAYEEAQNVFITYLMDRTGGHRIELVEGGEGRNPVQNLVATTDATIYHICYRVDDFERGMDEFKKNGFHRITKPFKSALERSLWACHYYHPKIGVVEIVGKRKSGAA